mgnify:CR=1 FL=1
MSLLIFTLNELLIPHMWRERIEKKKGLELIQP